VAAPVVTLGAVLVATLVSPSFSWSSSALSDLGRPGAPTALIFNGGLLVGALLALPYITGVGRATVERWTLAGTAMFGLAAVSMGLVGLFPEGHPYHFPAALSLYVFLTYGLFCYGSGLVLAGAAEQRNDIVSRGVAAIWLGVGHVTSWVAWGMGLRVGPGLAIPETIGAVIFLAWIGLAWNEVRGGTSV
jgi:hypothetical membrane protein